MNSALNPIIKSMLLGTAILLSLGFGYMDSRAQETGEGKATFYVY